MKLHRLLAVGSTLALSLSFGAAVFAEDAKAAKVEAKEQRKEAHEAKKEMKAEAKKEGKAPSAKADNAGLTGMHRIMADTCNLSEAQRTTLAAKVADKQKAVKDWNTANGEALKAAEAAATEARKGGEKEKIAAASAKVKALEEDRDKVESKHDAEIEAVLTPEQRSTWEGQKAYNALMVHYAKANLTDAQKADIKSRALAAGPALLKADKKADADIKKTLSASIDKEVLTEDQRKLLTPAGKKAEPKKEEPKKAEPKKEEPKAEKKAEKAK